MTSQAIVQDNALAPLGASRRAGIATEVAGSAAVAELAGVQMRFGEHIALAGVDLDIRRGEVLTILGPNGAGKSTAISLMLGLQVPTSGTVRLFGRPPRSVAARRGIGVMTQEASLPPSLRVGELIRLASAYYPRPYSLEEVAGICGIEELLTRTYGKLSGGQKRQAQFAMAICGRPKLLFLDEPTVGLDIEAREHLWACLRAVKGTGTSILLTTHYLEEAQALADRVIVLVKGQVVAQGSVAQIRGQVDRRRILCGTSIPTREITGWPEVRSVTEQGALLEIDATEVEPLLRRLLILDPHLHDVEVRRAGLAEAFVEITRESHK